MTRTERVFGLFLVLATFSVYAATTAPGLTLRHWGTDGGDLIAAARTLGVAHPPGYPTYTLMAWLATQVPIGSIAYRVNLLSAASAACAVGLVYASALVLPALAPVRWLPAAAGALMLAFAPLTWSQAIISEVYAPALLAASLSLLLALRWRGGGSDANLWAAALVFGLGLGIHLTLAFALLPAFALLWPQRSRWLRRSVLLPCIASGLTGLATFTYLPMAAAHQPQINWGDPQSWERFYWVVSGKPYQSLVLGLPVSEMAGRLAQWRDSLISQLGWEGWAIALLGLATMLGDRTLVAAGILWAGTVGLFAFFYRSPDSMVYLVPALLVPTIWLAQGFSRLLASAERHGLWVMACASALALLVPVIHCIHNWSTIDLSQDHAASAYADQVLQAVDDHAILLAQGDQPTFVLWYAVHAEEQRADAAAVNTSLLGFEWYRVTLRHHYPWLDIPEPNSVTAASQALTREIITRNCLKYPTYALDPSAEWAEWFEIQALGSHPVFRLRPRLRWESVP